MPARPRQQPAISHLIVWLAAAARNHPAAPALLTPHDHWSYGELAQLAGNGAARLRSPGLRAGDIAAMAGNASELALATMACAAADLALLPLDPLTATVRWPTLQALGGARLQRIAPLSKQASATDRPLHPSRTRPTDTALVIATSGSEGTPKAVMLSHANLDAAAAASNERLPLVPGDMWLNCLPLHHIGGLSILYRSIRAGATVLLHEGFDAAAVWRDLNAFPVTHLSLVPAMLARLLDCADGRSPPARLRYALVGGAALSRSLFERARVTGWPLCPSWGMSECTAQAATLLAPGDDWREGEVGSLLPGFTARIAIDGRIALRGPQVMAGYLNPEGSAGLGLLDGWLLTGDLGRLDAAGRLTILGRADDVLVSGGENVHPLEVESCLAACPGVVDVAVTAMLDPVWGDALVALVVGTADIETVRDWSRCHLASGQRPRRVLRVVRLPRNAMGKLERAALRALAAGVA